MSFIEFATAYAGAGWHVFPLIPNTKRPLTPHGFKDASRSVETITRWWTQYPNANIGLRTGQISGIVVVDVDVKNNAKGRESLASLKGISPTLTVATPSGGWHLYYACPEGGMRSRIGLLPGIDIKADGGYVVAAGSVIDDKPYEFLNGESNILNLPDAINDLMRVAFNGQKNAAPPVAANVILSGARNSTLAGLAGAMRRKGMDYHEISAALHVVNSKRCSPPLPDTEIETISASIARYPPESVAPNSNDNEPSATDSEEEAMPPQFTDDALALEFTKKHAEDWRYVAAWGHWLQWDATRWSKEATLKAFDLSRKICREAAARCIKTKIAAKIANANTVAAVERLARADRNHAATVDQWDNDSWLFNMAATVKALKTNGGLMIDLSGVTFRPHRREDYMTKMAAANPGTYCPTWLKFLEDVTAGDAEMQRYLARVAGYALTGVTTEHVMFFLYGTGANGKSVFLNTLAAVWGDYATNAPIDTFLETRGDRHPTDLAKLRGARLVIATEVGQGRRWDEGKIKALTGGDTISARFMRQDFFDYKPQFKLMIAGNHKPSLRNVDEAMRRRLHLIPFTVTIQPERRDHRLPERLWAERDGILGWAIEGCVEWQKIGLKPPASVLAATDEYFESQDSMKRWIEEECIASQRATTATEELFQSWKAWAEKQGEQPGSMRRFTDELANKGFERWRSGKQRGYHGIALKGKEIQEEML